MPTEVDPRNPLFFLSYARSGRGLRPAGTPHEPNRRIVQFFDDLSENVAELVPRQTGSDPGYMDRSIPNGSWWTDELLTAVGTCQVFVAMLSAAYFESQWCGMEWYAFSQRVVVRHRGNGMHVNAAIIPVVWAPIKDVRIPRSVDALQRFAPTGLPNPDIAAQYQAEGIYGLLQMGLNEAYRTVVWRLAQLIAELHRSHEVKPYILDRDDLGNAFKGDGS